MAYRIPVIVDNDEEVLKASVASALNIDYENPRIIIINNSLEIDNILISESMLKEAEGIEQISIQSEPIALEFDKQGNLRTQF